MLKGSDPGAYFKTGYNKVEMAREEKQNSLKGGSFSKLNRFYPVKQNANWRIAPKIEGPEVGSYNVNPSAFKKITFNKRAKA